MKRIFFIGAIAFLATSCQDKRYLFTSFHEPANEGLRLLYSKDGLHWKGYDSIVLKPQIGQAKIMRDPSMLKGPDGEYRLVWTTEWKGGIGFGYAHSKDLKHWSEQKYIPVMKDEPAVNVWAPELFYDSDSKDYLIVWASCIPGRFEKGIEADSNNHRLYMTSTKDFENFTPATLFLDPKFSVIDAVIVKRGSKDYVLVLKDNTRPERNIKVAFSDNPRGPWKNVSAPFSDKFTEGPAVVKVKDEWFIYYDAYQKKIYEASVTKDFVHFKNADSLVSVPKDHKHGTILEVTKKDLKKLLQH